MQKITLLILGLLLIEGLFLINLATRQRLVVEPTPEIVISKKEATKIDPFMMDGPYTASRNAQASTSSQFVMDEPYAVSQNTASTASSQWRFKFAYESLKLELVDFIATILLSVLAILLLSVAFHWLFVGFTLATKCFNWVFSCILSLVSIGDLICILMWNMGVIIAINGFLLLLIFGLNLNYWPSVIFWNLIIFGGIEIFWGLYFMELIDKKRKTTSVN